MLLKRPGTTVLAIVALALGIGLTTTMFSIVNGVFLRGLPFEDADKIVRIGMRSINDAGTSRGGSLRVGDLADLVAQQKSFEAVAALVGGGGVVAGWLPGGELLFDLAGAFTACCFLFVAGDEAVWEDAWAGESDEGHVG